jgi:hypothetical protein
VRTDRKLLSAGNSAVYLKISVVPLRVLACTGTIFATVEALLGIHDGNERNFVPIPLLYVLFLLSNGQRRDGQRALIAIFLGIINWSVL